MQRKDALEIYRKIEESLTDKKFLQEVKIPKKKMLELIPKAEWRDAIESIAGDGSFVCSDALSLCAVSLGALANEPSGGWLRHLYDYTVGVLYPEKAAAAESDGHALGRQFLFKVIRCFLELESQKSGDSLFWHIRRLDEEEINRCQTKDEYARYLKMVDDLFLYEFMRIGREITPHKLIDHVAIVHSLALHVARQVEKKGVPIDLALMSGAAASHDIGKFGCRDSENERIPYLHYYYTDQCLRRFGMPSFAHIAANHSTWDLELENLPVESLILIYSDFRVKDRKTEGGGEEIQVFSLAEAFEVILGKLDNVDEAKNRRYRKVYAKIRDFENYLNSLGIDLEFSKTGQGKDGAEAEPKAKEKAKAKLKAKDPAIMDSQEAVEKLKELAIEHNIRVMSVFNGEASFGNLLEDARGETQWKNIRAYINIFDEYSTYMNQRQKIMTLQLLYEMLMHKEGDIRRQAATLIGKMIAGFDEEYRKELPADAMFSGDGVTAGILWERILDAIVFPGHKVADQQRRWIGHSLRIIIISLLTNCSETDKSARIKQLMKHYQKTDGIDGATAFILIDAMPFIPAGLCSRQERDSLMQFAVNFALPQDIQAAAAALKYAECLTGQSGLGISDTERRHIISLLKAVPDGAAGIIYLKVKIAKNLGNLRDEEEKYSRLLDLKKGSVSEIFLENLKTGTPWILKTINIDYMLDLAESGSSESLLHIATHFSNLIKVSERVTVRRKAGEGLLEIAKKLHLDEVNEIVVELTKGLEIGQYQVSKYIPEYLGELALCLHPNELDELIMGLQELQESTSDRVSSVALDTLGKIAQRYSSYRGRFAEDEGACDMRRRRVLGMLLRGLSNYREAVSQEALYVIGKYFFASDAVSRDEKHLIFECICKKMLTLLSERKETKLSLLNNAAVLNDIYRFISDYTLDHQELALKDTCKIAFFPGTFDPFSLSHKGIVTTVRDLGFEVYLALDEFSWSKKTQARMIRRQIIAMSVADERNVYVFPDDIPVNIANPKDLKRLTEIWPGREIYMTVGSDVIANASSYKAEPSENSIHGFNHIVFKRSSDVEGALQPDGCEERCGRVTGDVIELLLPMHLEDISSTRIRENIDLSRDISNLIDPAVQNFIYDNSLYLREPQYKDVLQGRLAGAASRCEYKELKSAEIYAELRDQEAATFMRERTPGKTVLIKSISFSDAEGLREPAQAIVTEVLSECLKSDFTYAACDGEAGEEVAGALERQGFEKLVFSGGAKALYVADMKSPVVVLKNMEANIKAPFNKNKRVVSVIDDAHRELQKALVKTFPGELVLSISADVLYSKLVKMIAEENGVSLKPYEARRFGPLMCVPYGDMLKGKVVPNTVTKSLHTEKIFDGKLNSFRIKEFPYYSPIINQVRTIKSFNRPVILLDDILHKGYRIKELDPLLKEEGVDVQKIVVGILSGRGKDLMEVQKREVDSAYYIPNLRNWFVETSMYPFIGGDSIETLNAMTAGFIPSINLILPYVMPGFLLKAPKHAVYELSMTCLKNTKMILEVLEEEYQAKYERNLTLNRLSEVITAPRLPERGGCLRYDLNLPPSGYVANDIEQLSRLENVLL
ncbi:MAG: hypothetical protein FWG53_08665 [Clostridiales bacterium]|nr:hypothetical protein [Clostridiales bacterium]